MFKSILSLVLLVTYVNCRYRIPTPTIIVFKPCGLEMSIPDERGIELVTFNVSVRRPPNSEVDTFVKEVNSMNQGKWSFDRRVIGIKEDDVLHYIVHVHRDKVHYMFYAPQYVVTERIPRPGLTNTNEENCHTTESTTPFITTPAAPIRPFPTAYSTSTKPDDCPMALNNALELMSTLQSDLKAARNDLEILKEIASKQPLHLHLSGPIVQIGDPKEVVEYIILEKLHTNMKVKDAWKTSARNITFEVYVLDQKIEILRRAKKYLQDAKNVIITP